ncbi:MAG: hypothetical protein J6X35_03915 [Bacteroidales bacterium]|nr:hypothetical protein [Bacteroidales bacterium]
MEKTFDTLRQRHPVFTYQAFHYGLEEEWLRISFDFRIGEEIAFHPEIRFRRHPAYDRFWAEQEPQCLAPFVFHIGMIELISYWKCCCCPEIRIACGRLDEAALQWWKKLYYHGLGEFFYRNGIRTDREGFVQIRCSGGQPMPKQSFALQEAHIVPIGGGKDSVVTLETLKQEPVAPLPLIINPRGATLACVKASGLTEGFLEINRTIDPRLLELNAAGYLNGHTPFSAMLAFHSLTAAILAGRSRVALSNESSANEPTVQGSDVNHQYSKSIEFEADFREYVAQYLTEDVSYYSFLRPLSELQIACLFAEQPAYFPVFRSCNVGSKQDIWCGHCPKCLFTCIMLSAFLPAEKVREIFGKDLLEDETLWPVLKELCGETAVKPFECVGTREEVCMALCEIIRQYESRNKSLPTLLASFRRTALYESYRQRDFQPLLTAWDPQHFLPEDEELLLRKALEI